MVGYTEKLRAAARRLLGEGRVDCFIGFGQGSVPMVQRPVVITATEHADSLVWDACCGINLAGYVIGRKDRIGIVAPGCVSRNLVTLIQENQIRRDQLHIVGVCCTGMLDRGEILRKFAGREITGISHDSGRFAVEFADGHREEIALNSLLARNCRICAHHNPVIYDELIGKPVADPPGYVTPEDVTEADSRSSADRWEQFRRDFAPCIRCYACRNACPMCYCPTCFVDESVPQWIGKSTDPTDTLTFHFLRALHLAGRCTDCGACERACPLDIPVRYLTSRLNAEAKRVYDYESGLAEDQRPLLDHYRPDDYDDFFK